MTRMFLWERRIAGRDEAVYSDTRRHAHEDNKGSAQEACR